MRQSVPEWWLIRFWPDSDLILWATDWPHPNVRLMPNDGDLVDLIPEIAPDDSTRRRLLVDNPAELFGFG